MTLPGLPSKRVPSQELLGFPDDLITISARQPDGTMRHYPPTPEQVVNFHHGRPSVLTFEQARHLCSFVPR